MDKLLILGIIAVFILGPDPLPHYALQLGRLVKRLKGLVGEAKVRAAEELGPDFDVDWKKLDPRQYDPRRIIREALLDDGNDPIAEVVETLRPSPPTKITGLSLGGRAVKPGQRPDLG